MAAILAALVFYAIVAHAVDPTQMPTPALQERYLSLTHELRCVQCQNESIADSPVDIAADLRRQVKEMLLAGKTDGVTLSAGAPPLVPGMTLDLMAKHSLDFWLTSEDLPDPDNRVTVNRDGQIVLAYRRNNEEGHKRLIAKLKSLLRDIDCTAIVPRQLWLGQRIPLAGVAHQNGTLRFGHDPRTSVLDANCRTHEIDNLYVVDGSFFPSSAAVNPALTIMANALRVGDHLIARLGLERSAESALVATV